MTENGWDSLVGMEKEACLCTSFSFIIHTKKPINNSLAVILLFHGGFFPLLNTVGTKKSV